MTHRRFAALAALLVPAAVGQGLALPASPTDVTASPLHARAIRVTWVDTNTDETGHLLERQEDGGPFLPLLELPPDAEEAVDRTVRIGPTYGYRVRAVNTAGTSPPDQPVLVRIPPGARLEWRPRRLAFGPVPVGGNRVLVSLLRNTGRATLFGTVGPAPAGYALELGEGPFALKPGERLQVRVRFEPGSAERAGGSILLETSDPRRLRRAIRLSGTGR